MFNVHFKPHFSPLHLSIHTLFMHEGLRDHRLTLVSPFICVCCICVSVCQVCKGTTPSPYPPLPKPQTRVSYQSQRKASDTLELELQVVVNCLMSMLGTELGSSGSTASSLKCRATSPVPQALLNTSTIRQLFNLTSRFTSFERSFPTSQLALPHASSD